MCPSLLGHMNPMLPNTENTPIHTTSPESTRLAPSGNKAGQPRVTIALSPSRTTLTRRPTRGNLKAHSTNTTRLKTPHAGPWLNATKKSQPNCQRSPRLTPIQGGRLCSLSGRQGNGFFQGLTTQKADSVSTCFTQAPQGKPRI